MSTKVGGNNNTKIEYTYDTNRHPHTMSDPSLGMRTYSYNAFGELISETNNKGQTTNYSYDALGRMTSRTDEDGTTTWQYDQQMAGLLDCTVYEPTDSGEPSVRETFEYDQHGRLIHQNQLLSRENRPLEFTYEYNKYGQRKSITYPSGYALSYSYDQSGNMLSVKNSADGSVLWSASSTDKFGNITNFTLGSNINVGRTYDSQTGLVASLNANSGMLLVQSMQYQWNDNKGNLTSRTDNTTNHQENFTYDNYNRLTNIEIDGNNSRNITYDNLGNVSGKYDAGSMIYNSGNPYAVKKIYDIPNICSYDGAQDITYTSFDKVKSISQGTKTLNVSYGADRQRVRQTLNTGSSTKTKRYFTPLYEVVSENGATKKVHYLTSSTGLFAIFAPFGRIVRNTMTKKSLWKYHYTITDYLGNARVEFVPHNGGQPEVVQSVSYYPFGYTLHCNDYGSQQPNRHLFGGKELQDQTLAGITFGWYDFEARMYDPAIGRFMQTDPMAEKYYWISPYAYCANNPIKFVDPTGEEQIRVDDKYTVDDEGYIKLVEKTNDDFDVIYTKDSWDKGKKDNYIIVDKNVLSKKKTNSAEGVNGKKYSFDMYSVNDDITSKDLFEFLANNTKVEWSQTFIGFNNSGKSIISTSHIRNAEAGQGYLLSNGWTIRGHNHSHPFGMKPSQSDINWANSVQTKFPNVKLQIYFKGEYFEYDKYGILNLPFSNIPEVIIKPEDK